MLDSTVRSLRQFHIHPSLNPEAYNPIMAPEADDVR